jgi:hypothetical protein
MSARNAIVIGFFFVPCLPVPPPLGVVISG